MTDVQGNVLRPVPFSTAFGVALLQHALLLVWLTTIGIPNPARESRIVVSLRPAGGGGSTGAGGGAAASKPAPVMTAPAPATAKSETLKIRTPPPVKPEPKPVTKPETKPKLSARRDTKPAPKPAAPPPNATAADHGAASPERSPTGTADAVASAGGGVGNGAGSGVGSGVGAGSGNRGSGSGSGAGRGEGDARSAYRALLVRWLEKHKRYPSRALAMGLEAEVVLRIRLDARGRVRARSVERSDRAGIFERAAEEMVDRATPFPPLPSDLGGEGFELVVPVAFRIDEARAG